MSLFLRSGKSCDICYRSQGEERTRQEYQNDMFAATSEAITEADVKLQAEEIGTDDKAQVELFANQLRLLCFNCDGAKAYVYEEVKRHIADPLAQDISDAEKDVETQVKQWLKDKGVEKRGNLYIIKDVKASKGAH